jgi:hypothetical protein
MYLNEELNQKWGQVLDHDDMPKFRSQAARDVTGVILENTLHDIRSQGAFAPYSLLSEDPVPVNSVGGGGVTNYDPVLITLVRRAMPNLVAYDLCGVQPMTGPTGLIFAMRSRYANQTGNETFYNEVNTAWSSVVSANGALGQGPQVGSLPAQPANTALYNFAGAMPTAQAEALGADGNVEFAQMAFSIEKVTVVAQSRALKAEYTMELAQDLKAIHGLDAETELANILTTEILAEINREVIRTINITASPGAQYNTATPGIFDLDTDSNGRWSVEKFKGLMFQLERDANAVAKATRRGKGNILICSSDVASALQMAGVLDYTPALNSNNLQVDDTGNTFAGVLNGRIRVYIDPYAVGNYVTIGYKGASSMDAGLFYCPYVPLQMVRAVGQDSFQPKIGFKTRYGIVANPYAGGINQQLGQLVAGTNVYYRMFLVNNLM